MGNIFINSVKKFEESECSVEFLEALKEYKFINNNGELFWFSDRKHRKNLKKVLSNIDNKEYKKILYHIYTPSPEESEFYDWVILINEFKEFIIDYADPLFYNIDNSVSITSVGNGKNNCFNYTTDTFKFSILFEKSNIKKNDGFSLFDSITGLDKGKNLIFITIAIENLISKKVYNYEYIENGSINNKTDIDDDICDIQLEIVKNSLNNYMITYIENIFDRIILNKTNHEEIKLFTGAYLEKPKRKIDGDIWKEWIGTITE